MIHCETCNAIFFRYDIKQIGIPIDFPILKELVYESELKDKFFFIINEISRDYPSAEDVCYKEEILCPNASRSHKDNIHIKNKVHTIESYDHLKDKELTPRQINYFKELRNLGGKEATIYLEELPLDKLTRVKFLLAELR